MPGSAPKAESSDQNSTREKLILTAEMLFADFGVDAVSMRNICLEAGQRNVASVHYHFGDKAALLEAIFKYREAQLEPQRAALLKSTLSRDESPDIRSLLRVSFEPYERHFGDEGVSYLKLMLFYLHYMRQRGGRYHIDYRILLTPTAKKVLELLGERLNFLDDSSFDRRIGTISALFFSSIIQNYAPSLKRNRNDRQLFEDTLEMMVAALCAPISPSMKKLK